MDNLLSQLGIKPKEVEDDEEDIAETQNAIKALLQKKIIDDMKAKLPKWYVGGFERQTWCTSLDKFQKNIPVDYGLAFRKVKYQLQQRLDLVAFEEEVF